MNLELFNDALKDAKNTWGKFFAALCILDVGFLIDALGGFEFFHGKGELHLGDFKVVREALSGTYGVLFFVFIVTAAYQAKLLRMLCPATSDRPHDPVDRFDKGHLWLLSPLSPFGGLRFVFWLLFAHGFFTLALFSTVHLTGWQAPPGTDPATTYRLVGFLDLGLFLASLFPGWSICRELGRVRWKLRH